jgi:DNA (cytosine-5)-methyltransferase 1
MTLGLKQTGFRVIGVVEIDPLSIETYCRNHKGVKVRKTDIRNLSTREVVRSLGFSKMVTPLLLMATLST